MRTRQYLKTGRFHQMNGQECQDRTFVREKDGFLFAAVADGATACSRSGTGAEIACRGAADFFDREREQVFDYPAEKLCYLLTEHILYFLETETGGRGEALHDYASTILAAWIETETGRTLLVNLGDGCILRSDGKDCDMLLSPKRYHGNPCLTTTEGAYRAMELRQTVLSMREMLLLCTDGFLHFLRAEPERLSVLAQPCGSRELASLEQKLEASAEMDDSSYLAIWRA